MKAKYIVSLIVTFSLLGLQFETALASDKKTRPSSKKEVVEGNTWMTLEDETKHFTCPVCDMLHTIDEAKASTVIQGKKYYLCHPSEQVKLRARASVYLGDQFFVPGNLYSRTHEGATFKDPVNGEVAGLNEEVPYLQIDQVRYFFTSETTKQQFEEEQVKISD